MKIGVLALQGNYGSHEKKLNDLGAETVLVRKTGDLDGVRGLVLPGGESSALLKLLEPALRDELVTLIERGLPVLATCAGVILLAKSVRNPNQDALGLLDVEVIRNAYGRQVDSFIEPELTWTNEGRSALQKAGLPTSDCEAVFIRAPKISRTGPGVDTLATCQGVPVLVQSKHILAATFHPELSETAHPVHRIFLGTLARSK